MRFKASVAFAATAAMSLTLLAGAPASAVGGRFITINPIGVGTPTNDPTLKQDSICTQADPTYAGAEGLQTAINTAVAGDTIRVCNTGPANRATYVLSSQLNITVPLTLIGARTPVDVRPALSGNNVTRVINVNVAPNVVSDVSIQGFDIIDGHLANTSITTCDAPTRCGAGLQVVSGNVIAANLLFKDNSSAVSGGAVAVVSSASQAHLRLASVVFENNTAAFDGAAMYVSATSIGEISNSYVINNTASLGSIIQGDGTAVINFSTFVDNTTPAGVLGGTGIQAANSIIAQRLFTSPLCESEVTLLTGNLVTDTSCGGTVAFEADVKDVSAVVGYGDLHLGRYIIDDDQLGRMRLTAGSVAIDYLATEPTGDWFVGGDFNGDGRSVDSDLIMDVGADEWDLTSASTSRISRTVNHKLSYGSLTLDRLDLIGSPIAAISTARETITPSGTVEHTSLTPDVCTITSSATLDLLSIGTCQIETYRTSEFTSGQNYEEYVGVLTLNIVEIYVPSTPRNIAVVATDRKFTVSWSTPLDNGGALMRDYTVLADPQNGGASVSKVCTTSPCVLTGVTNEGEYLIRITATNSAGKYKQYSKVGIVTPPLPKKPSAPTNPKAITAKKQVRLNWDYPETWSFNDSNKSKNAVIIRLYMQTASKKVIKTVTLPFVGTGKYPLTKVIKGLVTGKKMIARIFIKSKAGESPASKDVKFTVK